MLSGHFCWEKQYRPKVGKAEMLIDRDSVNAGYETDWDWLHAGEMA